MYCLYSQKMCLQNLLPSMPCLPQCLSKLSPAFVAIIKYVLVLMYVDLFGSIRETSLQQHGQIKKEIATALWSIF